MIIKSIKLENFRNISHLNLEFHQEANFLLGENGSGKTNLVEAIYVNFFSKSFRTNSLKYCIKNGKNSFNISSEITIKGVRHNLSISYTNGKKTLKIDGKNYLIDEYLKFGMIFVLSAKSSEIIYGSPSLARKFFDSVIVRLDPAYMRKLVKFKKIYQQKKKLIERGIKNSKLLNIWNVEFSKIYIEIFRQRMEIVKILNENIEGDIFSKKKFPIKIKYHPSVKFEDLNEKKLLEKLNEIANAEFEKKRVLIGPHRDKFEFFYKDQAAKHFASAGERRSILLNIYKTLIELTESKMGEPPVFIFDDIETEIDTLKLKKLLNTLNGKIQIFLTSSKPELLSDIIENKKVFLIDKIDKG